MTATVDRAPSHPAVPGRVTDPTWTIGAPRLLAGLNEFASIDFAQHRAIHDQVHGPLPAVDRDRLIAVLDRAQVAGRGGAGFPAADKLRALAPRRHARVVVNATESEPASGKDRVLLRRAPHVVVDGALRVAEALRTTDVTIAVHDEVLAAQVRRALQQRPDSGRVQIAVIGGGFVSGEARAVLRGLSGMLPLPPGRRTPPSTDGVFLSNAETFAQIGMLLRMGPARFAETGTHREPGTTLLTVGGAVSRPGVVEVPLGTPLPVVLSAAGAPSVLSHVVVGGYHGAWLRGDSTALLSHAGLKSAGGTLGAGVVLALDPTTCALGELARVGSWLASQSAGQCGPCRFGLPALAADVEAARRGDPRALGIAAHHADLVTGRGACSHPDGAARFIRTGLAVLGTELDAHRGGRCTKPVRGQLPIGGQ